MFEHDYTLQGKHATMLKFMANSKAQDKEAVGGADIFDKYITVYMNAAIWGILYNQKAAKDMISTDRARIYADAFIKEHDTCIFVYRLVLLLDKQVKLTNEERIDRAFRDDAKPNNDEKVAQNLEVFNSYIRGGLELMYQTFIEGCSTKEDYLERITEVMQQFSDDIDGISYEEKLAELLKN